MPLPQPTGPCAVGTIELQFTDESRPRHLASDASGRCMQIRLWYPADPHSAAQQKPELVWSDLRHDRRMPGLVRAMLSLLRTRSTARPGAPALPLPHAPAPIIYHHGFISFAAENESLLEMAASHGHLVVSIQHMDQLAELQALQRLQPVHARKAAKLLESQLIRASAAERTNLARSYYTSSGNTNRIVMERAADTSFVLDRMPQILAALPGMPTVSTEPSVHLMGFSVGGAVATAFAQRSPRARTVINIDGGTQGVIDATSLRVPYLMIYSAANSGINDALLPQHARRMTLEGTRHLNFHDIAGLIPALRFTPALGKDNPLSCLQKRNDIVCSFLKSTATGH